MSVVELLAVSTGPVITLAVGYIAGRRKTPKPPKVKPPTCGCGHVLAVHDPETSRCHEQVKGKPTKFDVWDDPIRWELLPCPCRQYVGPRPIDEVFAPRLLPPEHG